ncbi:Protein kinase domain-containing protein [Acetitomaculum ruminis DSM 5522]|uniref:Protein kinase domain-containing protein n=1 Tax=Acetitomaculum ruminis DSM 5522 TaxID=1120918 RepID=A0A1I0Z3H6_9FIRM|nr:protein kinase [Acetitomaculum ruminis]SFB19160.1 Protein kinase domain-containing protein [Acetitomaculum ruminis DSM 5522]
MLSEQIVKQILSNSNTSIILENESIDPVDIFIFTDDIKELKKNFCTLKDYKIFENNGKRKFISFISFSKAGLISWKKYLLIGAEEKASGVYKLDRNKENMLWLYYLFIYANRDTILTNNILNYLKEQLQCDFDGVVKFFKKSIHKNHLKIQLCRSYKYFDIMKSEMAMVHRYIAITKKYVSRFVYRVYYTYAFKKAFLFGNYSLDSYVNILKSKNVLSQKWDIMSSQQNTSTACCYIKTYEKDGNYFLKGNEIEIFNSIKNEIEVQKTLSMREKDNSWFLKMTDYSEDYEWIKYPYLEGMTLKDYSDSRELKKEEITKLGKYLVFMIDKLNANKIIHNDLRSKNIMVKLDEDNNIADFTLIDFGSSLYDGKSPWNLKKRGERYLAQSVAGSSRYNDLIVDDAAAAEKIYYDCGGVCDDEFAKELHSRIGRIYYISK